MIKEGDSGTTFFIIEEGKVAVTKGKKQHAPSGQPPDAPCRPRTHTRARRTHEHMCDETSARCLLWSALVWAFFSFFPRRSNASFLGSLHKHFGNTHARTHARTHNSTHARTHNSTHMASEHMQGGGRAVSRAVLRLRRVREKSQLTRVTANADMPFLLQHHSFCILARHAQPNGDPVRVSCCTLP